MEENLRVKEERIVLNWLSQHQADGFMMIPKSNQEKYAIALFALTSKFLSFLLPNLSYSFDSVLQLILCLEMILFLDVPGSVGIKIFVVGK